LIIFFLIISSIIIWWRYRERKKALQVRVEMARAMPCTKLSISCTISLCVPHCLLDSAICDEENEAQI